MAVDVARATDLGEGTAPAVPSFELVTSLVEELFRLGRVLIQDPLAPGAEYELRHMPGNCPHVRVGWRPKGSGIHWTCIECDGHWCEGCNEGNLGADFTTLPRAMILAIFAGRRLEQMDSFHVCSTGGYQGSRIHEVSDFYEIEESDGEGSEGEEARPGRTGEPGVTPTEDEPTIAVAIDALVFSAPPIAETVAALGPPPGARIEMMREHGGSSYYFRLYAGNVVKTVRWEDAFMVMWGQAPAVTTEPTF